jgi:predicted RND superfamily exporter protein
MKNIDVGGKVSKLVLKHRLPVLIAVVLTTAFWAYHLKDLEVYTAFDDLLPQKHPYIQTYNKVNEKFGGANFLVITVEVKEGYIFNYETLKKIRVITEEVDVIEGVNHYQVESIAHRKVRSLNVSGMGVLRSEVIIPLKDIPQDRDGLNEIRKSVHATEHVYGRLVSLDDKAALISVGFYERRLDYNAIFKEVKALVDKHEDENHKIHVAGQPMLTGWVFFYQQEMYYIFALTGLIIVLLLFYYFRRPQGIAVPLISAVISGVWGLGFAAMMGYNIDPLILVIPLLISARAVSHSVQYTERFQEIYEETQVVQDSAQATMKDLFVPGMIGVLTDAAGVFVIATATVRQMKIMAFFCSFWVVSIIVSVLLLVPIMLSYFPMRGTVEIKRGLMDRLLHRAADGALGKRSRWGIIAVAAFIAVFGVYISKYVEIGDTHPGSPLLWPDSQYNTDVAKINEKFYGSDKLSIFVDGDPVKGEWDFAKYNIHEHEAYMKQAHVHKNIEKFRKYMERDPKCGGSMALPDIVKGVNKTFHFDDPRWFMIPEDPDWAVGNYIFMYIASSAVPGSLAEFADPSMEDGNVTFFYKDHINETVDNAVAMAKEYLEQYAEGVNYSLAGGNIGVLAASNEEIERVNWVTLVLVFCIVFIFVSAAYRSVVAGFLILTSLALANLVALMYMVFQEIGLDINTLPVACVGVGVGVDYAVYIVDRVKLEYRRLGSYPEAIREAISTTGRAVSFTATTLVGGIILWYFLSSIRFQAEMSILLSIVMIVNMFGAIILIPTLYNIFRPKFIKSKAAASEEAA